MKKLFLLGFAFVAMSVSAQTFEAKYVGQMKSSSQTPREETMLSHSGEVGTSLIGVGGPAKMQMAHIWDSSDLTSYVGWSINKIEFIPGVDSDGCTYTVMIWDGETGSVVLKEREVEASELIFQEPTLVDLRGDFEIKANEDYYVGYQADTQTGHPFGMDEGPADSGMGDLIRIFDPEVGAWEEFESLYNINNDLNYNVYLRMYLHNGTGMSAVLSNVPTAFVQDGMININNAKGEAVLYNMNGQVVYRGEATSFAAPMVRGTYVLTVGGQSIKLAI